MKIVIFANGENPEIEYMQSLVAEADYIIAADGGIFNCLKNNVEPNCIIGDFDSLKEQEVLISKETDILRITEQESTDMEKAIEHAKSLNPDHIDILCAFGKRMDHTLGNIFILNNYSDLQIQIHDLYGTMFALNPGEKKFSGLKGTTMSLFALTRVENIYLNGFEFSLQKESIGPSFIGVSNKISDDNASIKFEKGRLIVYQITDESNI